MVTNISAEHDQVSLNVHGKGWMPPTNNLFVWYIPCMSNRRTKLRVLGQSITHLLGAGCCVFSVTSWDRMSLMISIVSWFYVYQMAVVFVHQYLGKIVKSRGFY